MCLWGKACLASGYGERLSGVDLPPMDAVLVNTGVVCSTAQVYRRFDDLGGIKPIDTPRWQGGDLVTFINYLAAQRNDLQAAAIYIQPVIAEVLKVLQAQPQTLLARMSGSGATCFALCDDKVSALTLAQTLSRTLPKAWIKPCRLS
jgi:4-diphosphocytidyl-2-C-methyl-D-erythritol kinase